MKINWKIIIVVLIIVFFICGIIIYSIPLKEKRDYDYYYSLTLKPTKDEPYELIWPIAMPLNGTHELMKYIHIVEGDCTYEIINTSFGLGILIKSNSNVKLEAKREFSEISSIGGKTSFIGYPSLSLINNTKEFSDDFSIFYNSNNNSIDIEFKCYGEQFVSDINLFDIDVFGGSGSQEGYEFKGVIDHTGWNVIEIKGYNVEHN